MYTTVKIKSAKHVEDYKIEIKFSDGKVNVFDYRFLVNSDHQEFKKYADISKFKKFSIGEYKDCIYWGNNWEMILPVETLYAKKYIRPGFLYGRKPVLA